jgi:hypothetical protein
MSSAQYRRAAEGPQCGLVASTVGEHGTALDRGRRRDTAAIKSERRGREGQGLKTD